MRIPNREINIFNMSMLDVICGALGAFLIVTVVLFPSYQNKATVIVEKIGEAKKANERLRQEIVQAKRAAEVPPQIQQMMRENRTLEEELAALEKSRASRPPSPGSTKQPPLLVWIAWTRPGFTKHFTVSLGVVPVAESKTKPEVLAGFKKQGLAALFRMYDGASSEIAEYRAPREKSNTVFDDGLEYVLVTDPKPKTWYITYTVRERTEFPGNRQPKAVPVYGFAVYGNQEVRLPEVSLFSRDSSVLVGVLSLDSEGGLRFDEIMEQRNAWR